MKMYYCRPILCHFEMMDFFYVSDLKPNLLLNCCNKSIWMIFQQRSIYQITLSIVNRLFSFSFLWILQSSIGQISRAPGVATLSVSNNNSWQCEHNVCGGIYTNDTEPDGSVSRVHVSSCHSVLGFSTAKTQQENNWRRGLCCVWVLYGK